MFNELLLREFNLCCPLQTKLLNEKDLTKPWINGYIKGLIKKRQNYFKLLRQQKMSRQDFNRFRNFVTDKIRASKKEYFHQLFHEIKSNIKRTWKVINTFLKPKSVLRSLRLHQ